VPAASDVGDAAAIVSAIVAIVGVVVTVYVVKHEREGARPLERPILALERTRSSVDTENRPGYELTIRNRGKRSASAITFRGRAVPDRMPLRFVTLELPSPAQDHPPESEFGITFVPDPPFESRTFIQVEPRYTDASSKKTYEGESYWLVVNPAAAQAITLMDRAQREAVERLNWPR
jgi:hypothetical protein